MASRLVRSSQGRSCQVTSRASREGGPHGRLSSLYGLFFVVTFLEFAFLEKFTFPLSSRHPDKVRPVKKLNRFCRAEHDGDPWCFGLGCVYTAEHIHRPALPAVPGCGDFRGGSTFSGGGHYFELSDKSILWRTQYSAALQPLRFSHYRHQWHSARPACPLRARAKRGGVSRRIDQGAWLTFLCFMVNSTSTFSKCA